MLLLYFAYCYDQPSQCRALPASAHWFIFIWMLSLLPCVQGKSWSDICILLPWFPLSLPQYQRNLPFKLKGDLMFLSIAALPLALRVCGISMRFADFQNGRCTKALAPVSMSRCQLSKLLMNQNICIICGDVPKFYCSHRYFWVTNSEREICF